MKQRIWMIFQVGLCCLVFLYACRNSQDTGEKAVRAVVPATVIHVRTGTMAEYAEFPATSSFLERAVIKSPITGYVETCFVSAGDRAKKSEMLFELRTKEATILYQDSVHALGITGLIQVRASIEGLVSVINHPKGDFVQEGEPLCTLVLPQSLVFILELPFEQKNFVRIGSECILLLPDNDKIIASIHAVLPAMTGASQTVRVILQPRIPKPLPENLIARVKIIRNLKNKVLILPKSSVLSDEVMKNFWVMKLINDSIAVKIPVIPGITGADSVEIVSPVFLPSERFLTSGNYGLGDTAVVRIIK
ncbi:MAG: HlyD family efflux transporter periplasmic adaptor subunit [Bacteroidetes bacterium]|nr:HlyD family efflux transporter periplasmic adaptor subunit [Bacteroidota bacterium]